jgi:hypothetical protein
MPGETCKPKIMPYGTNIGLNLSEVRKRFDPKAYK